MNRTLKTQWQHYKELELIADSLPEPPTKQSIAIPLQLAWKVLVDALVKELVYEQQVEYLERCLAQSHTELHYTKNIWQKLWNLME